ncbi:MAG: hypothetical protein ACTHKK_09175 [Candidatus Nitrosocosmicus sp.]
MKIKEDNHINDNFILKSPKLKGDVVENILALLSIDKDYSISELLFEIKRKLPLLPYKILRKYLVYLADYELISYNGQRHSYQIEDNGVDLLELIKREKEKSNIKYSDNLLITIERDSEKRRVV